jgi:hypothetical protein
MDLAKYPSQGQYQHTGLDFSSVKLSSSPTDGLVLVYPSEEAKEELLNAIQHSQNEGVAAEKSLTELIDEADEFDASEIEELDHAAVFEKISGAIEEEIAELRQPVRRHITSLASKNVTVLTPGTGVTYGKVQVTDPAVKFAVRHPLHPKIQKLTDRISFPSASSP